MRHRVFTQQEVSQHSGKMALSARRRLHSRGGLFKDLSEGSEDGSRLVEQFKDSTGIPSARAQQTRKGRRRQRQAPLASMTMGAAGEARDKCRPHASTQFPAELP